MHILLESKYAPVELFTLCKNKSTHTDRERKQNTNLPQTERGNKIQTYLRLRRKQNTNLPQTEEETKYKPISDRGVEETKYKPICKYVYPTQLRSKYASWRSIAIGPYQKQLSLSWNLHHLLNSRHLHCKTKLNCNTTT